jgi:integrase/recombinase XerD
MLRLGEPVPNISVIMMGVVSTQIVPAAAPLTGAQSQPWTARDLARAFLLGHTAATRDAYRRDLASWFEFCDDVAVEPLAATRHHVDAYARQQSEVEGRSPATVARHLSTLSGFYTYAVGEEAIARNPVANVKRPKVGTDTVSTGLDRDELAALVQAAGADSRRSLALVLLLGLNGLRISEVLGADVEDIGTERGHRVLYVTRKGGKRATVPLAPRTAEAVDEYVGDRTTGPLFTTATGHRWHRSEAWRTLRRLAKTAVPDKAGSLHPHDLRHAFVTLSLDAGASLRDVQDAAGHADPRTTRRYDRARHNLDKHPTYALAGLFS